MNSMWDQWIDITGTCWRATRAELYGIVWMGCIHPLGYLDEVIWNYNRCSVVRKPSPGPLGIMLFEFLTHKVLYCPFHLNLLTLNLETYHQNISTKLFSFLSRNPFNLQFKLQNSSHTKSNQTILNDNVIRNVKVQLGFLSCQLMMYWTLVILPLSTIFTESRPIFSS